MSKKDEDFMSLWGKKAGANPQASVIGGLQKQITERDKEIEKLTAQLTTIKARLAEDVKILEESEKTLNAQAGQIQELKNQLYGKGGAPPDKGEASGAASDMQSPVAENKQLKKQIKDFQDKIYVFSMLPDRITELEKKNEKLTRMIDQYEANEKKLTDTVKKLSIGAGSEDIVLDLQDQVKKQEDKIKQLQAQLETAKEQAMFPTEAAGSADSDVRQLKLNLANLTSELNRAKLSGQEEKDRRIELEAKVDILKRTLEGAKQSGGLQGANVGNLQAEVKTKTSLISDLEGKIRKLEADVEANANSLTIALDKTKTVEKENQALRGKVASVEEKYKDATLRFENLVASKTKGQAGSPIEVEMKALRAKVDTLSSQNETLASEKSGLEEQLKAASAQKGSESLIKDLQGKLTKQKQQIELLEADNKALQESAASASKAGPAVDVDKIQAENASLKAEIDVMKQAGKGGDAALRNLVADLQTKLSQQKLEVAKLKKENVKLSSYKDSGEKIEYLEKQVAQLKEGGKEKMGGEETAGPAQPGGPLSTLVSDLQSKLNSAKAIMTKQEADLKKLESKLRDYQTKERMIEDKLGMADTKLASATKKDLESSQKVDELASYKKKSSDDEVIISQLNNQLQDATERATKAETLVKDRDAELKELEDKVQNLRDALAHK